MTLKLSTALRNQWLSNGADGGKSLADILKGGIVDVYSGTRPTNADAIETENTATFLFRLLKDGGADVLAGPLTVGETYKITTYGAGDDFTNVGGTNVADNVFTATGTTPTVWTNGSILQAVGLSFDDAVGGVIEKPIAETWKGIAAATGIATWFRFYSSTQDIGDGVAGDKVRLEGRVAVFGGQMQLKSVSIVLDEPQTINTFKITMPE